MSRQIRFDDVIDHVNKELRTEVRKAFFAIRRLDVSKHRKECIANVIEACVDNRQKSGVKGGGLLAIDDVVRIIKSQKGLEKNIDGLNRVKRRLQTFWRYMAILKETDARNETDVATAIIKRANLTSVLESVDRLDIPTEDQLKLANQLDYSINLLNMINDGDSFVEIIRKTGIGIGAILLSISEYPELESHVKRLDEALYDLKVASDMYVLLDEIYGKD